MKPPPQWQPLVDEGLKDSVVRQLMSGKEAMVCVVCCGDDTRCARIYQEATREPQPFNLHNGVLLMELVGFVAGVGGAKKTSPREKQQLIQANVSERHTTKQGKCLDHNRMVLALRHARHRHRADTTHTLHAHRKAAAMLGIVVQRNASSERQ